MNQLIEKTLDDLVARIEAGTGDWYADWIGGGLPTNYTTGRRYHGANILLLWAGKERHGYATAQWATYRQWQQAGYQVKAAERSTVIFITKEAVKKGGDKDNPDDRYRLLRCAYVFNAAQLTEPPALATVELGKAERIEACERLVERTGAVLVEGDSPAYSVTADTVRMPPIGRFLSTEGYYATLFHELVHWTAHKDRCDREMSKARGPYAFEELVAELGAAFISSEMQLQIDRENSAAYLGNWLKATKEDRATTLMKAASAASKAHEFIIATEGKEVDALAA